ncbi:MAG TPA: GNAT family N-acetyltransferase [Gemmatales bacterium]|nr:GNAT family N-acetyltransferase [Gemmatales bacterium]
MTGRSAAFLQGTPQLELFVFSKPYFDRRGLFLAEDAGQVVGFAHAGFGPDEAGGRLDYSKGVVCLIVVHPKYQRLGIGTQLLHLAEDYLRAKGATEIYAGGSRPLNPFYWGLYGGSELPGLLLSDAGADFFFQAHGYELWESSLVFQRQLNGAVHVSDSRISSIKRKYEVRVMPRPVSQRWFDECTYAPLEILHFQIQETATGMPVGHARMWDMDPFAWRWHQPSAGIIDVVISPKHRRLGLGKFLVFQVLRYIQEQFYALVEVQCSASNEVAVNLYNKLGFRQVDEGRVYRLVNTEPEPQAVVAASQPPGAKPATQR